MAAISFSIVFIKEKKDNIQVKKGLEEFIGERVVLCLDKNNPVDAWAVKVLFPRHVASVRKQDSLDGIYDLVNRQITAPVARITGLSDYDNCLCAEVDYNGEAPKKLDMQALHSQWLYKGPVFNTITEIVELNESAEYILAMLSSGEANYENLHLCFDKYVEYLKYGFTKELRDKRKQIDNLLKVYPDEKVKSLRQKLTEISSSLHSKKTQEQAFFFIIKKLKKHIRREFMQEAKQYSISEIAKQLEAFPSRLTKSNSNVKVLPQRVFYETMSEEVFNRYVSAYALLCYLREELVKGNNVKRKPGRPKDERKDPCPILKHIVGNKLLSKKWYDIISEYLKGKKNEEAGYTMKAFVDCGVLDCARYRLVKDSFGDIGTDRIYNKALHTVPDKYQLHYDYLCKNIKNEKLKMLPNTKAQEQ